MAWSAISSVHSRLSKARFTVSNRSSIHRPEAQFITRFVAQFVARFVARFVPRDLYSIRRVAAPGPAQLRVRPC